MFAGGIGITPLLAMVKALDFDGGDYRLHYSARSLADAAFVSELAGNPRVVLHVGDGHQDQLLDADAALSTPSSDTAVYVCGPVGFMDHVLERAEKLGWPADALHKERFAGATVANGVASPGTVDSGTFTVRLASTGAEYEVPDGRTVLEVLLENGVDAPYSCQQGICGECIVKVLAGEPDHRDDVLSQEEQAEGLFTTCSSRSASPVLELDL